MTGKMEIQIWDKGSIAYLDGLIGSVQLDLENRVFGVQHKMLMEGLILYKDKHNKILEKHQKELNKEGVRECEAKLTEIHGYISELNNLEGKIVPREYRELIHPAKPQS